MDTEGLERVESLYRSKYRRFFRLALAVLGQPEAAADAVHEGFVRALRSLSSLRDQEALEPWVWRTVLNVALSMRATISQSSDIHAGLHALAGHESGEDWGELRAAITLLPERQRSVVFLRHYADLDYEQIGAVLGIARGTVAATLHQAHAALRGSVEVAQ